MRRLWKIVTLNWHFFNSSERVVQKMKWNGKECIRLLYKYIDIRISFFFFFDCSSVFFYIRSIFLCYRAVRVVPCTIIINSFTFQKFRSYIFHNKEVEYILNCFCKIRLKWTKLAYLSIKLFLKHKIDTINVTRQQWNNKNNELAQQLCCKSFNIIYSTQSNLTRNHT
jgi:hypothetical protein